MLVSSGWSAPERVAVRGGSAGGLLVGACLNLRPDLFGAVVAEVPFVDVVNTMHDETLPLTVTEWEEWGDPRAEPWASYMLGYSPYENVAAVAYPPLYVTAGLNDPRVSYHEPAKWVAKLRAVATGGRVAAAQVRDGRRSRRPERPLRALARRGQGPRLPARRPVPLIPPAFSAAAWSPE